MDTAHFLVPESLHVGDVVDIGGRLLPTLLKTMLEEQFVKVNKPHERTFPTELFYNKTGLKLWERITRCPEYSQTSDEIDLLQEYGKNIAQAIEPDCVIIDMGSGDIRKIWPLLEQLEAMERSVKYFALDLSEEALRDSMAKLAVGFRHVQCFGLWGTFSDGLELVQNLEGPKMILSLGSMFGNDEFDIAVSRLLPWSLAMKPYDHILLGMDALTDTEKLWASYHDTNGAWEAFIRNGLQHSNNILGHIWYHQEDWIISGKILSEPTVHRFVIKAIRPVVSEPLGLRFKRDDAIEFFESWKYCPPTMRKQFESAKLNEVACWKAPNGPFYQYLLQSSCYKEPEIGNL